MSTTTELVRADIRQLRGYRAAEYVGGFVRLNANESPWRPPGDASRDGLNRYPDPRPAELTKRLASHYGVVTDGLLVTRGSSEAIDVVHLDDGERGRLRRRPDVERRAPGPGPALAAE